MRLIDADALVKEIAKMQFGDMSSGELAMAFHIHDMVIDAPTIEAEPVRHGRWVLKARVYDRDVFHCSKCGREEIVSNWHLQDMTERFPYCHCGAKMDGGDGDAGEGP